MATSSLFQLIAACVGIVGSIFFAIGVMRQSTDAMAALSGTYFDWNPHMPPALAAQKADYLLGGGLILVAFVLQLASFFPTPQAVALTPAQAKLAPWLAVAATALLFLCFRMLAKRLATAFEHQINARLRKKLESGSAT